MYPYITSNNLIHTQAYNYTSFEGVGFMSAYVSAREGLLQSKEARGECRGLHALRTSELVKEGRGDDKVLRLLIKTFEVNKRLYARYEWVQSAISRERILKPDKTSSYTHLEDYLGFGFALCDAYTRTENLLYLNTLLKLNDTLISLTESHLLAQSSGGGGGILMPYIAHQVEYEMSAVAKLVGRIGGRQEGVNEEYKQEGAQEEGMREAGAYKETAHKETSYKNSAQNLREAILAPLYDIALESSPLYFSPQEPLAQDSKGVRFAMIYALTARSKLYFDALVSSGLLPSTLVILGDEAQAQEVAHQAQIYGCVCHIVPSVEVNDECVFACVASLKEDIIVYSGYGGGILQARYFGLNKRFIHIHAGALPHYRGSTTCYYSLLERGEICASAMILDERLDCGDVIADFRLDMAGIRALHHTDIDTGIEPYIRAQALLGALHSLRAQGASRAQVGQGETYYRIHPVLKHLAILRCFGGVR